MFSLRYQALNVGRRKCTNQPGCAGGGKAVPCWWTRSGRGAAEGCGSWTQDRPQTALVCPHLVEGQLDLPNAGACRAASSQASGLAGSVILVTTHSSMASRTGLTVTA